MRGMSGVRVAVLVLCAFWAHDAAGQNVTAFSPSSGVIQVPATGPGAPAITVDNTDPSSPLFVDLPSLSSFQWADASATSGSCVADVTLPSSGPITVTVDPGGTCILSVAVLAAPPPGQSVEEGVTLTAYGSATLSGSYTLRATSSGGGGGPAPANDHFAAAEDLSGLAIPPYVALPHPFLAGLFQPRDTVSVAGTTLGSTREPYEYGTVVNPDGSETPPPNGTVWFRYTSPQGGFGGRLGYRVTPGFFAAPLVQRAGAAEPMPDLRGTDFAPGNTWPPSGLSFVRMEPGHTVWFQVQMEVGTDGDFTLELYQAPNEQDSISNAYSITGADNPDGTGRPWTDGFNWFGDGDTYHLTADQPGGPPNMWFTATFDRPGFWTFRTFSEQATRGASTRPLGLRLYRAPSGQRVSDPSELTFVQGTDGSLLSGYAGYPGYPGPVWSSALVDVPVEPGRYYWSVDEGPDGPTYYSLNSSYRATPVNTPPAGVDDAVSTPYETPVIIAVLANDTDAENDPLAAGAFANLVGGTLSQPGDGTVVFTPSPNFVGTGGFTYRPFDGTAQGNVTRVTVEVRPVTSAPRISVRVVGTGPRAATVDLEISNIGGATASAVVIDRIKLQRLDGKGAIRLVTPVPITIGSLASGGRRIVTVSLTVDPRVRRFAISERGRFVDPAGRTQRFVAAQAVIP